MKGHTAARRKAQRAFRRFRSSSSVQNHASRPIITLASRICVAYFLATDAAGDGFVYSRLAKNLLEQNVFSVDEQAPFTPTLIRMPGYPLFMAGVYYLFGHDNNMAVRIVEAVFDTATCVIVGLLAWFWTEDEQRKRKNALWGFLLSSLCPF